MDNQMAEVPSNSNRVRINWTVMMERYFIDLMLDQLQRGNRMGNSFNNQAWMDILAMFNGKFGTKYDREILKSHHTNLWKQYNDVKNLLEHNGFSWDDTQKMVLADDDVWDAFIKAHPDAQYYKKRSLVNFNDLCLIYAYTEADGRYSRSSHDIDLDDEIQGVISGAGMGSVVASGSIERVKTDWKPAMDKYFVEIMLDQVKMGNKRDGRFSKQAWKDMLTLFNAKFCSQYSKVFLQRRYRKLFKYYADIRTLLEIKGFSWDERQQKIVADDSVWEKYIKAYPNIHSYRKRTLPDYKHLNLIYGKEVINGHAGHRHQDKISEDETLRFKTSEGGGHSCAGTDFLKPYWTPEMDRYLIDLLQDQALRGNKIGHELTNEAWVEMVRLFRASFEPQYDKIMLENRYKHLRMQYIGLQFLLEQTGFSWDENLEMVTAEDYVWDSYIKVFPDARLYRNRSVPSYHKLCVIFGEESSNGKYSHGANDADFDSEGPVLMIGDDVQCHLNGDCSKTDWTPSMDRYFIDLLVELVHRGRKVDFALDPQAWIDLAVSFKERFGLNDIDILKSRYESLGRLYFDMKNLLAQRRISWDGRQELVAACNDVWDACIAEHPDARHYRSKPKPNYNDLFLVFGNSTSGEGGSPSRQGTKINNSYCQMSDWTPPMDRYFIDLMLEHVHQGSMVHQELSQHAWNDIVAKFGSEFGSQNDEDVLKRRFVNLRKQFHDVENLLDQHGFAWDELQRMIVGDDQLWNAYGKEYPNALIYRYRTLPNFNDLFLIFGDKKKYGRHDYLSPSTVAGDYFAGLDSAEKDGVSPSCSPQINWTKPMELYFIELLLEQVCKGNEIGQQAWTWIIASFNDKFGVICDKDDVLGWYLSLMKEYNNINYMLNQDGFAWDEIQQKVTADDDDWNAYIKEHPGAAKYKDRVLGSYNDLCVIYGNTSFRRLSCSGVITEIENNALELGMEGIFGGHYPSGEFEKADQRKKRKSVTASISASSRKAQRQTEAREFFGLKPLVVQTVVGRDEDNEHIPVEVIVDALQAIPDMDDELFLEACQLLENDERAKLFVAMDVNDRRKWLFRKLGR